MAVLVLTALAFAGSSSPAAHAQALEGGPKARVDEPVVDLGSVPVGPRADVEFIVENEGGEVLRIYEATTGCDCMLAEFDETVAPGETGRVRASLLTEQVRGVVAKSVLLRTNDPERRRITLTIRAYVESAFALLPQRTMYLRKRDGQPPVGRILIRAEGADVKTLAPSELRPSVPWLTASVVRLEQPRERGEGLPAAHPGDWLLEVRFRDDEVRYGRQAGTVGFKTGLARQPSGEVEVESNIVSPVELSTDRLVLAPRGARGFGGTLFASVRSGLDPSVLRVDAEPAGLTAALELVTERMYQVDVVWNGDKLERGALVFRVGHETVRIGVERGAR